MYTVGIPSSLPQQDVPHKNTGLFLHILSNLLFINNPIMWSYTVWITYKETIRQTDRQAGRQTQKPWTKHADEVTISDHTMSTMPTVKTVLEANTW